MLHFDGAQSKSLKMYLTKFRDILFVLMQKSIECQLPHIEIPQLLVHCLLKCVFILFSFKKGVSAKNWYPQMTILLPFYCMFKFDQ